MYSKIIVLENITPLLKEKVYLICILIDTSMMQKKIYISILKWKSYVIIIKLCEKKVSH